MIKNPTTQNPIANISLSGKVLICYYWSVLSSMWSHLLWHKYDLELTKGLAFTSIGAVHEVRIQLTKLNGQLQLTVWPLLIVMGCVQITVQWDTSHIDSLMSYWTLRCQICCQWSSHDIQLSGHGHSQRTQVLMVYLGLTKKPSVSSPNLGQVPQEPRQE